MAMEFCNFIRKGMLRQGNRFFNIPKQHSTAIRVLLKL